MSICPITGRSVPNARDLRGLHAPFDLWDQTDDSLARLRRQHLRAASELAREDDLRQARREWWMGREVRDHQLLRVQLRMRYGAVDDHRGTSSYDCWLRHDEPPGYTLAMLIDSARARAAKSHMLHWPSAAGGRFG